MQGKNWKWGILLVILLANAILWIVPSDVTELIARERHTLLGRYSKERFFLLMALIPFSALICYFMFATRENIKKRIFKCVAVAIVIIPGLLIVDFIMRLKPPRYLYEQGLYRRLPNAHYKESYRDVHVPARTYPTPKPGYPQVDFTLQVDSRGFRNSSTAEKYDILALGDSFTEGSKVSDEHPWVVKFAQLSGLNVYNMGMSGTDPVEYLGYLKLYGDEIAPKTVICMLYEGNDYRRSGKLVDLTKEKIPLSKRFHKYWKSSPLRHGCEDFIVGIFGPINANGLVPEQEIFSWIPLAVPAGENAKYYSFPPKRILELHYSKENFAQSKGWQSVRLAFDEMHEICQQKGIRLVIVYAPTKVHVVLPLARDDVPADKLRAYAFLRSKKKLPAADQFKQELLSRLDAKEQVAGEYCQERGIDFVSVTQELRDRASHGDQIYFTYDQHWTPEGHEVVAQKLYKYWQENPKSATSGN